MRPAWANDYTPGIGVPPLAPIAALPRKWRVFGSYFGI